MSASPEVLLNQRFEHLEGIVWHARRNRLLWLDVFKGLVISHDLSSGSLETHDVGRTVGSVAPRDSGGLICAVRDGFGYLSEAGDFSMVKPVPHKSPALQMNDGGVDARGRFWAGSMSFEYETKPGLGALYRFDPDDSVSTELEGVNVSNGIGWSPDSRRCYYVDSATYQIDEFDYDVDSGTLRQRRTLATVESSVMPDGLAVDVDGCIWVALFQGSEVRRYTPEGKIDRVVRLPGTLVTTCTFGGDDLRTLFIAVSAYGLDDAAIEAQGAGRVYAFDPGVQGLPVPEFLG